MEAEAQIAHMPIPTGTGRTLSEHGDVSIAYGTDSPDPAPAPAPVLGGASGTDAVMSATDSSSVSTHMPIPAGVENISSVTSGGASFADVPVPGANQIPAEGQADGGTVVTGADSITGSGPSIPIGAGSGIGGTAGNTASGSGYQSDSYAENVQNAAFNNNYSGGASSPYTEPPTYRNITMGSGQITGVEVSPQNPSGIQFAMYHAGKYTAPDGNYSVVKSLDGAKWYKQYAMPAVERTPLSEKNGKVQYQEKIVKKLPKAPPRTDRI